MSSRVWVQRKTLGQERQVQRCLMTQKPGPAIWPLLLGWDIEGCAQGALGSCQQQRITLEKP